MSKQSSLHRVLEILNRLNSGEKLCVSRLANEYEVSERTIQRDFKMIIEVFNDFLIKDGECYRGYKKVLLDELLQGSDLMMLSNIVNIFDVVDKESIISYKTKNLIKTSKKIYSFKSKELEKPIKKELLKKIEHAILFQKEMKLLYHGRFKNHLQLYIHPYRIILFNENFYLLAQEVLTKRIQKIRLSNIEKAIYLQKQFYKDKKIDNYINNMQSLWAEYPPKEIIIHLKANKILAKYFLYKKYLSSQKIIEKFDNGDMIIEYKVTTFYELYDYIFRWLPNIKILKPIEFKDFVKKELISKIESLE